MEERRKINAQHKHKDKRRNARSQVQPNAPKTTRPQSHKSAGPKIAPVPPSDSDDSDSASAGRSFGRRALVSNADRYARQPDEPSVRVELVPLAHPPTEGELEQINAADFGQLLRTPAAHGSYFRFKKERDWDDEAVQLPDDDAARADDLFRMHVTQIEDALLRIPFYERQAYPLDTFTFAEQCAMRMCASSSVCQSDDEPEPTMPPTVAEQLMEKLFADELRQLDDAERPDSPDALLCAGGKLQRSLLDMLAEQLPIRPNTDKPAAKGATAAAGRPDEPDSEDELNELLSLAAVAPKKNASQAKRSH